MSRSKRRRRNGSLVSIASLLDGLDSDVDKRRPLVRTFSWWDATVSDRIARHARPVKLYRGTLIVHTSSAAWAQELSFHEEDLLRSVQARVPSVQRIRIRTGPFPRPPGRPEPPKPEYEAMPVHALPGEVARALAGVGDDEVRVAITKAACTSLSTKRREEEPKE